MKPENVKEAAALLNDKEKLEELRKDLNSYAEMRLAVKESTVQVTINHLFEDWRAGVVDMIEAEIDRLDDKLRKLSVEMPVKSQEGILGDGYILTLSYASQPGTYSPDSFRLVNIQTNLAC